MVAYFFCQKKLAKLNIKKFELIIDLQSKIRNTYILQRIPYENFYSSTYNFKLCSVKRNYFSSNNITNTTIDNLNKFFDINILKKKYGLDHLSKKLHDEAKRLLPNNNYIGFSITQGNIYRKKSWPIYKFIRLANEIVKKNKIPVFFIEKDNLDLINEIKLKVSNAIFPELNSKITSPALITALSSRLEKAVSIDNGIMHMIGLADIPLIVLFGPTNSKKFIPENSNVEILDSKEIYKSEDISKITVEEVLNLI